MRRRIYVPLVLPDDVFRHIFMQPRGDWIPSRVVKYITKEHEVGKLLRPHIADFDDIGHEPIECTQWDRDKQRIVVRIVTFNVSDEDLIYLQMKFGASIVTDGVVATL